MIVIYSRSYGPLPLLRPLFVFPPARHFRDRVPVARDWRDYSPPASDWRGSTRPAINEISISRRAPIDKHLVADWTLTAPAIVIENPYRAPRWERDFTAFRAKSQSARIRKSDRASDEADEIPPYSSSSSMNVGNDIAQLSYKELQALALRYRVPGNIKVGCHPSSSRRRRPDDRFPFLVRFKPLSSPVSAPPELDFIRTLVEDRAPPIDRRLRSKEPGTPPSRGSRPRRVKIDRSAGLLSIRSGDPRFRQFLTKITRGCRCNVRIAVVIVRTKGCGNNGHPAHSKRRPKWTWKALREAIAFFPHVTLDRDDPGRYARS